MKYTIEGLCYPILLVSTRSIIKSDEAGYPTRFFVFMAGCSGFCHFRQAVLELFYNANVVVSHMDTILAEVFAARRVHGNQFARGARSLGKDWRDRGTEMILRYFGCFRNTLFSCFLFATLTKCLHMPSPFMFHIFSYHYVSAGFHVAEVGKKGFCLSLLGLQHL